MFKLFLLSLDSSEVTGIIFTLLTGLKTQLSITFFLQDLLSYLSFLCFYPHGLAINKPKVIAMSSSMKISVY